MGQPINLVKGKEKMVVYGQAQAQVHIADGWKFETAAVPAEEIEEPAAKPAAKPKAKK